MEPNDFKNYLEKTIVVVMIMTAVLIAFFKPAVSIGMVGLATLSLIRAFSSNKKIVIERGKIINPALGFIYLFFLMWLVLSVFWSVDVAEGLKRLQRFSVLLLIPLIVGINADLIIKYWRLIFKAGILSCSLAALPTFWFFIFPEKVPLGDGYTFIFKELEAPRDYFKFGAYSPFLDRLYFGYLCGFCLLGLIYFWIKDKKAGIFHLNFFLLIPLFIILGARGAQLAFSFSLIVGFFYFLFEKSDTKTLGNKTTVRKYAIAGSSLLVVALLIFLVVRSPRYAQIQWELGEYRENPSDHEAIAEHSVILRLISWSHNIALLKERPFLGFGMGDYVSTMEKSYEKAGINLPVHSNQQFLFFGVIGGLPGLLAFLLSFLFTGWFAWKRMKSKSTKAGIIVLWVYMFVVMMFDSPLNYHMPSFLFLSVWLGAYFTALESEFSNRSHLL